MKPPDGACSPFVIVPHESEMSKNKDRRKHEENMRNKREIIPMGADRPIRYSKGTELTAELQDAIIENIMTGAPLVVAAVAAGVNQRTYYAWERRGDPDSPDAAEPFLSFVHACEVTQAQFIVDGCGRMKEFAKKDWVANITMMERRFPEYFARRLPTADEGKAPTTININLQLPPAGAQKQPAIEGKVIQVALPEPANG